MAEHPGTCTTCGKPLSPEGECQPCLLRLGLAGMASIAAEGELYFNIHTRQQTFYGDIRGQLLPVSAADMEAAAGS